MHDIHAISSSCDHPSICLVLLLLYWDYIGGYVLFILLHSFLFSFLFYSSFWFPSHYAAMSTETTNAVSMPTAEDNQQHEKIVKEETHAVEQGDIPPSKDDAEKCKKENCEAEKYGSSEISITKSEETQVVNQAQPPVVEVEKADHVPVQNVEADHESRAIEALEYVPAGVTASFEAVENEPGVEKRAIEAIEKEPEKTQTIEAVAENELEKTQPIEEADEKKPVEKIAIEAVDKEADENKPVEKVAIAVVENEPETQAIEACENKEVEKVAMAAVENDPETQAIEACEHKQEEIPSIKEQIDEKPKIEAFEFNPSSEIVKPEENVEGERGAPADDEGKTTCELSTNEEAQKVEKEADLVENDKAAEKDEKSVKAEQATEESDENTKEASSENEAKKTEDRTKEVLVKEDEYKDIKVHGEEAKNESKSDVPPTLEPCKDGEHETQTSKDQVQDVSVKPAQKQSGNNIISKVKQSLVKVKKAIIGKSPSSKVLTPEIKGDPENNN